MLVELEHKAKWAMKKLKMDWNEVVEQRLNGLNEVDEFHLKAYESSALYNENKKSTMTKRLRSTILWLGIWCFLFISRLHLFFQKTQIQMDSSILYHPSFPSCNG